MRYVVVIPSIYQPYTDSCLASLKMDDVLVVDNTVENHGVSASWNRGIDHLRQTQSDWLVIMSAAMRFGAPGGLDFIEHLHTTDALVVETTNSLGPWHLAAFRSSLLDAVGRFDQNLYPGYWEDVDYDWRMTLMYGKVPRLKVEVDCHCESVGHGVELGGAPRDVTRRVEYVIAKWGDLHQPIYDHPFNDPDNPPQFWPESLDGGRWDT